MFYLLFYWLPCLYLWCLVVQPGMLCYPRCSLRIQVAIATQNIAKNLLPEASLCTPFLFYKMESDLLSSHQQVCLHHQCFYSDIYSHTNEDILRLERTSPSAPGVYRSWMTADCAVGLSAVWKSGKRNHLIIYLIILLIAQSYIKNRI